MYWNGILRNWNLSRILFLFLGFCVLYQSIQSNEWLGYFIGSYFLVKGVFSLGCASGNCGIPNSNYEKTNSKLNEEVIEHVN